MIYKRVISENWEREFIRSVKCPHRPVSFYNLDRNLRKNRKKFKKSEKQFSLLLKFINESLHRLLTLELLFLFGFHNWWSYRLSCLMVWCTWFAIPYTFQLCDCLFEKCVNQLMCFAIWKDLTLNRRAFESIGFLPEKFKIGCQLLVVKIIVLVHIFCIFSIFYPPVNAHSPSENDLPAESCSIVPACTSSIDQLDHSQIVSQGIQKSIQEANTASTSNICTSLMSGPESGNNAMILDQMNSRKRLGIENDYSEIMERKTTKYFRYAIFNLALSKKINRIYFVGIAEMNGYQKLIYIKKKIHSIWCSERKQCIVWVLTQWSRSATFNIPMSSLLQILW